MEEILNYFVAIIAILCTIGLPVVLGFIIIIKAITSDKKIRMELARQGIIPPEKTKPVPNKYRSLRNGFLCLGIAIGLIISIIVCNTISLDQDGSIWQFLIVVSSVLFFMGIAYFTFYYKVKDKEENSIDSDIE